MDKHYEVREYRWYDDFHFPSSAVIKGFNTKEDAEAYIEGLRNGTINGSMLVNDVNNLFIESFE